jgi:hypothetical protein
LEPKWHCTVYDFGPSIPDEQFTFRLLPGGRLAVVSNGFVASVLSISKDGASEVHALKGEVKYGKLIDMDYQLNHDGGLTLATLCEAYALFFYL